MYVGVGLAWRHMLSFLLHPHFFDRAKHINQLSVSKLASVQRFSKIPNVVICRFEIFHMLFNLIVGRWSKFAVQSIFISYQLAY